MARDDNPTAVAAEDVGGRDDGPNLLELLALPRSGRIVDLDSGRWPGMPLWSGHPPFQLMTYRTPAGLRAQADQEWLAPEVNDVNLGLVSELMIATCHSGTHIDALAHVTCGLDDHWHGGVPADGNLGDFGPTREDASQLPALVRRGVLIDVARFRCVPRLERGYGITADDLRRTLEAQATALARGDVVLVRTGQMSVWPDTVEMERTKGAGITLEAAAYLVDNGAVAVGVDTESAEVVPSTVAGNPHPVHQYLLVESGVYIIENIYLEELSERRSYEFLFIALPLKIRGATASMLRPIAIL